MELSEELRMLLRGAGADLVGFGDLRGAENCGYPTGISVARRVPREIVRQLSDRPTREYYEMYHAWNAKLDEIVTLGADFLRVRGYKAFANSTSQVKEIASCATALPHKTVAVRAGLGWIGKNCLLVTPEYGGAVRLSSILTDAPLPCAEPILHSRCGSCRLCVEACPAQALRGTLWEAGMPRSELLDWQLCLETQKRIMRDATGIEQDLCGKCFAVCRYTQQYAAREEN